MTSTLRVIPIFAVLSLAAGARADEKAAPGADPMAGWNPPKAINEKQNRKEIDALMKKMEAAGEKGDLDAAAALVDFPVLMTTDDSKGEAVGDAWSREQWVKVMAPFYAKPMPKGTTTMGKPTVVFVSNSLAMVGSPWTMKVGGKKVSGTSATLLVRKAGEWKVKAMMEGGWGDLPMEGTTAAK